jgi:hypothetical protein
MYVLRKHFSRKPKRNYQCHIETENTRLILEIAELFSRKQQTRQMTSNSNSTLRVSNQQQTSPTHTYHSSTAPVDWRSTVTFKVICADTQPGDSLLLVGSVSELGCWQPDKAVILTTNAVSFPVWKCEIPMSCCGIPFEFKFILKSADGALHWEDLPSKSNRNGNVYGGHFAALDCGLFGYSQHHFVSSTPTHESQRDIKVQH